MAGRTVLGIIGGSGLYQIEGLTQARWETVDSPFGAPSDALLTGNLDGVDVVFLPRHGRGHVLSPSTINYRANIDALKRLGCTDVLSVSASGLRQLGCLRTRLLHLRNDREGNRVPLAAMRVPQGVRRETAIAA